MGWLSIKIFNISFDTLIWSVWNLDNTESDGSVNPVGLSQPSPEHSLFHSSNHLCTTGLDQEKLPELCILNTVGERCSLTTFAEDTKVRAEMPTWEGRANLQEDQDRLEECANNFLSFSIVKTAEVHTSLCRRNSWILLSLVRKMKSLRAAGSEMCHMLTESESPSGAAAQVAEGQGSELSVLTHQHCHQYFIALLHGTGKGNNLLFITFLLLHKEKKKQYFVSKCNTINKVTMMKTTAPCKIFAWL